jgi:hypothetical protein
MQAGKHLFAVVARYLTQVQRKTIYRQAQTRSADEPMTVSRLDFYVSTSY